MVSQSLGTGEAGFSDQQPVKMDKPIRFSKYKEGTFLFVDFNNYSVREVDENGAIKTLFGGPDKKGFHDGNLEEALFEGIHGVT